MFYIGISKHMHAVEYPIYIYDRLSSNHVHELNSKEYQHVHAFCKIFYFAKSRGKLYIGVCHKYSFSKLN